jgi:uncharacterized protein
MTLDHDGEAPTSFWSDAHLAVEHLDLARLAELLNSGADVQDPDQFGFTLLHHAIDSEADAAIQTGSELHVDLTALLLSRGADPTAADNMGRTPLSMARGGYHWLAADLLKAWLAR